MKFNIPTTVAFLVVSFFNPTAFCQDNALAFAAPLIEADAPKIDVPVSKTDSENLATTTITDRFSSNSKNNYNLYLNGSNQSKTVFVLSDVENDIQNIEITGIFGGTDGKIIILKTNSNRANIVLSHLDKNSDAANQIKFSSNYDVDGYNFVKLMYSTSDYKWHTISQL